MKKGISWEKYYMSVGVLALLALFADWRISLGLALGTVYSFLNQKLILVKFPRLTGESTTYVVGRVLLVIFLQGLLMVVFVLAGYFLGKLYAFGAEFVAIIAHSIFLYLISMKGGSEE